VTSTNVMVVQKHPDWSNVGESRQLEVAGDGSIDLRETRLRSVAQRLLIWDWYRISGHDLTNPYLAKLYLARDKLLDRGDRAAAVIVAAPYDDRPDVAVEALRQFVGDMKPSIDAALVRAGGDGGAAAQ
jgi:EpsI family protein